MKSVGRNTTAGVLCWTPAPQRPSPCCSLGSELDWVGEDVDEGEDSKVDFHSQMDENGIIGLDEALGEVCLGGDEEEEAGGGVEDPAWYSESMDQEGPREGCLVPTRAAGMGMWLEQVNTLEELQDSEPLSQCEPPREDTHTESLSEVLEAKDSMDIWSDEEEQSWQVGRQQMENIPERDRQLDMTEDERELEEEEEHADRTSHPVLAEPGLDQGRGIRGQRSMEASAVETHSELSESDLRGGAGLGFDNLPSPSPLERPRPIPKSLSPPPKSLAFPLRHFSSEEFGDAPGIQAETFPVGPAFSESLVESRSSHACHAPRPDWLPDSEGEELTHSTSTYSAAIPPESRESQQDRSGHQLGPSPSPRKLRPGPAGAPHSMTHSPQEGCHASSQSSRSCISQTRTQIDRSPKHRSRDADLDQRGPLTYPTPDFSKVEPRVRFPKSGYTPPKSKGSPRKWRPSVEPPLVFKSPADIVREVLLSSTDGPHPISTSNGPRRPLNSTVPEEFRCPEQASTLVQQLQEDYTRLLTKYAEAENTIDRMRLKAKVDLYSDPPKPSPIVQSHACHDSSKVMTLTFPHAQRVEFSSASTDLNGQVVHQAASTSSRSLGPGVGEQLSSALWEQAARFLQQVHTFEQLLRRGKPKPFEYTKGLSQLLQDQDCLERGYLRARDQHRVLEQRGAKLGPFDPVRELESCIFQCGIRLEELKEQLEQAEQAPLTSEGPPPPHPTPYFMPAGGSEPMPLPENPVLPVPGECVGTVGVEVSSASSEEEEEGMGEEEALPSLLLHSLRPKHRLVERDFNTLMNHYQRVRVLPPQLGLAEGHHDHVAEGHHDHVDAADQTLPEGPQRGPGTQIGHTRLPERELMFHQQDVTVIPTAKPRNGISVPSSPKDLSQPPAALAANDNKRSEFMKSVGSSGASMEERAESETRGSKGQAGNRKEAPQDGLVSPETDSGFVGSESSLLTPAVPGPLHQRAAVRLSVTLEHGSETPRHRTSVPSNRPQRSPSLEYLAGSYLSSPRRVQGSAGRTTGGERRGGSASSMTSLPWAANGTSEVGDSDSKAASCVFTSFSPAPLTFSSAASETGEDEGRSTPANHPQHPCQSSPSPNATYCHGDPIQAPISSQLMKRNQAIQSLQAEVSRLKERLEGSLRHYNHPSPVTAPPAGQEDQTHPSSLKSQMRSAQRSRGRGREEARFEKLTEEGAFRSAPRRSASTPRLEMEWDITRDSEHAQSTPKPRSSRRIPESPAAEPKSDRCVSAGGEVDRKGKQASTCPQCLTQTHQHRKCTCQECGGDTCLHTHYCSKTSPKHDQRTKSDSGPTRRSRRPMRSPHRDMRGVLFAVQPPPVMGSVPLVQCVPVCPPVMLYSSPVKVAPPHPVYVALSRVGNSGPRHHKEEVRCGSGRSLSADQRALSSSLNQAIDAAREVRAASRRMAVSISTGLHRQRSLSQSCMY
ncbi:hypothetical protein UPYG_G00280570 [Umbra pygmaea]|uniref:AKNA domain-containing protein n=1 Tax=Umbra pygmaea TaxID=75934 RepID=A0ABD0WM93_UMBPY